MTGFRGIDERESHNTWHAFLQPRYVIALGNEAKKMNIPHFHRTAAAATKPTHIFTRSLSLRHSVSYQRDIQDMISISSDDFDIVAKQFSFERDSSWPRKTRVMCR